VKRALIVLAHPNPASFNARLARLGKAVLTESGYDVRLLDLYTIEFPPPSEISDFTHAFDKTDFDYKAEQRAAYLNGTFHESISACQKMIAQSDLLIFQFPMWWFSMPSVLKNWIEKCFSFDFAYNGRERRWFSDGPFRGKTVLLSITTSGPRHIYTDKGINGDINTILWPIQNGIFHFVGFRVLPAFVSWASDTHNRDKRHLIEQAYADRLRTIDQDEPIPFHPLDHFTEEYLLREGYDDVQKGSRRAVK